MVHFALLNFYLVESLMKNRVGAIVITLMGLFFVQGCTKIPSAKSSIFICDSSSSCPSGLQCVGFWQMIIFSSAEKGTITHVPSIEGDYYGWCVNQLELDNIYYGVEICDNGKDDNADGKVDCDDPLCKYFSTPNCPNETVEFCGNGFVEAHEECDAGFLKKKAGNSGEMLYITELEWSDGINTIEPNYEFLTFGMELQSVYVNCATKYDSPVGNIMCSDDCKIIYSQCADHDLTKDSQKEEFQCTSDGLNQEGTSNPNCYCDPATYHPRAVNGFLWQYCDMGADGHGRLNQEWACGDSDDTSKSCQVTNAGTTTAACQSCISRDESLIPDAIIIQ
jgi:hypothetical protein